MNIYYSEHDIDEGFEILEAESKHDRIARGRRVSRPSGWALFHHLKGHPIKCRFCGIQADRWVVEKGPRDLVSSPVMNLFAGGTMMTRDHYIPKSLGGKDHVANLLPACAPCNETRSNTVDEHVIEFARLHPELIDPERIKKGLQSLKNQIANRTFNGKQNAAEVARLEAPFRAMGYL